MFRHGAGECWQAEWLGRRSRDAADHDINDQRRCDISHDGFRTFLAMTDPEQGGNRRGAIAGLAIAVVLLVVGVWLAHQLTAASKMQDCLMSGRTNCNVIPAQ